MTSYSPSSSTAWGSVFYINHEMWLRLVHPGRPPLSPRRPWSSCWPSTCSRCSGRAPIAGPGSSTGGSAWRCWSLTVGFGHTGYQLPWDQKGYWATKVVTNIMGGAPVIGPYAPEARGRGHASTATRRSPGSSPCTSAVLPALFVVFLAAHIALVRRHGPDAARGPTRARTDRRRTGPTSRSGTWSSARAVHRRGGRAGPGRGRRQPGRPGRSLERRLPGAAGVVLPLALPDAQVLPRQSRGDRHDRDPRRRCSSC